jgi:hypothetical protein
MLHLHPEEADAHSLTDSPSPHVRADVMNSTNHLVPGHSGKGKVCKLAIYSCTVGVSNPARFYTRSYLPRAWPYGLCCESDNYGRR